MLREEGLLDLGRWKGNEMRDVPIPTSVQGLISSRLDRLEPKEKRLAHHAAVIGAVFWAGAVAHLGAEEGTPPDDPSPGLAELERRDFVAHLRESTVAADKEYSVNLYAALASDRICSDTAAPWSVSCPSIASGRTVW